jgi:hypothetical protein
LLARWSGGPGMVLYVGERRVENTRRHSIPLVDLGARLRRFGRAERGGTTPQTSGECTGYEAIVALTSGALAHRPG